MSKRKSSKKWPYAVGAVVAIGFGASALDGGHYKADAASGLEPTTTIKPSAPKQGSKALGSCELYAQAVYNTGLRGQPLVRSIATALAENPKCDPKAKLHNGPTKGCPNGSTDRGYVQANDCYHPEISTKCAQDVDCAAKAQKRISHNGTDFRAWSTTANGKQAAAMSKARDYAARAQS